MEAGESTSRVGWISFLIFSACVLLARLVYWYLASSTYFPINQVKIAATFQHVSREQIRETLSPYLNYSYFSLPVARLKDELAQTDWVKHVVVDRIWPDRLRIKVVEKSPIVAWNNKLMTADGKLFTISHGASDDDGLPRLFGPEDQQQDVLQQYQKLSKILTSAALSLSMLRLHPNQSWTAQLSSGVLLKLGKRDVDERVTRFCGAYRADLADRIEQLAIVDLRYARGMAVKWKEKRENNG